MKNAHQAVRVRVQVVKDGPANLTYIASNDALGVFVKAASFRDMLVELRDVLALRLKGVTPSLQFYSADIPNSPTVLPETTFKPSASRVNRVN